MTYFVRIILAETNQYRGKDIINFRMKHFRQDLPCYCLLFLWIYFFMCHGYFEVLLLVT